MHEAYVAEAISGAVGEGEDGAMSEWGIALIAAGSAIAGSIVTGWYTRGAGIRQAAAARHAGDRQADALLASVRMTLQGEAAQRALALRRQVYAEFLGAAEARILAERTGGGQADDEVLLQRALGGVVLEGPAEVAAAAGRLVDCLRRHEAPDDLHRAKLAFVEEAQRAANGDTTTG
ncbi:hypothetical protein [Streptomyces sp. ID38640]|uniref:hypothetical protein n=1 Tax=Streptomyces sp. ID38640 TaxID=1265399 RepID=UPI002180D4E6|nr:hypothetical protein [Streptomyces sp. ID38640]